jgi:hypothetical protein
LGVRRDEMRREEMRLDELISKKREEKKIALSGVHNDRRMERQRKRKSDKQQERQKIRHAHRQIDTQRATV